MLYKIKIINKFNKSKKYRDWEDWTGIFNSKKGYSPKKILNLMKKYFKKENYPGIKFGMFTRNDDQKGSSWSYLMKVKI